MASTTPQSTDDSYTLLTNFEQQWTDESRNLTPAFLGLMRVMKSLPVKCSNGVVLHHELHEGGEDDGDQITQLETGAELCDWLRQQAGFWLHGPPACYREEKVKHRGVVFYFGPADPAAATESSRAVSFHIALRLKGDEEMRGGKE